jgi:hypothetical protein
VFLLKNEYYESSINTVFEGIYRSLKLLRTNPFIGASLGTKTSIPNEYRYLVSGNYILFYKVFDREKLVRVYRIYHCKENYLVKLGLGDQ